jgi:DNA-binding beta-propeller fold protein YncE
MSIGANGMLTVLDKAPLGALPEGVAFSPNSQYVYIGNYADKTLQVFRIAGNRLAPVETNAVAGPTCLDARAGALSRGRTCLS